ncbi:MAG: preprotein translocase subunit SecE [Eggerthellaceae bacterium]
MAKKSKTQRAKASANRAAKKERAKQAEATPVVVEEEAPKKRFSFKKSSPAKTNTEKTSQPAPKPKKAEEKPKKKRFAFFREVRSEMRRVTWPTKQEVLQWTGVVIVALLFFGVFVVVLDDWVVTPILFAISGLGA